MPAEVGYQFCSTLVNEALMTDRKTRGSGPVTMEHTDGWETGAPAQGGGGGGWEAGGKPGGDTYWESAHARNHQSHHMKSAGCALLDLLTWTSAVTVTTPAESSGRAKCLMTQFNREWGERGWEEEESSDYTKTLLRNSAVKGRRETGQKLQKTWGQERPPTAGGVGSAR